MKHLNTITVLLILLGCATGSCKKMIEAKPPVNEITSEAAFKDSAGTVAALLNIYSQFGATGGSIEGYYSPYPSLYADELEPTSAGSNDYEYYTNSVSINNATNAACWSRLYYVIYECNALLKGITGSPALTGSFISKTGGEAKFLRAFSYFLLVNYYGDVPLVLSTDVTVTASLARNTQAVIYKQILQDLTDATGELGVDYPSAEKVRANKWAAEALLAKVNLYTGNWKDAEAASDLVLNSGIYTPLEEPANVFLANSKETILQFEEKYGYSWSGIYFQPFYGSVEFSITPGLLQAYESNDLRRKEWIDSVIDNGIVLYYPAKYRNSNFNMVNSAEYTMCLRVAEQYLIRAEARCHEDKTADAVADVNIVRNRAAIDPVSAGISKDSCLNLIEEERKRELFTEWGNRFFDLKRTGKADMVLGTAKANWKSSDSLLPVPQIELNNNPSLIQNQGY